jgi:hypothetical protein
MRPGTVPMFPAFFLRRFTESVFSYHIIFFQLTKQIFSYLRCLFNKHFLPINDKIDLACEFQHPEYC